MNLEHERSKANLREFAVAIGAVAICVSTLVIGTWVFLRLSAAGDELRAVQEGASGPGGLRTVAGGFGDPEKIMAAWSVPVMLGVLGASAIVTGLWAGMMSRRRPGLVALIGIAPLYVIAFAASPRWSSVGWAVLYTVLAGGMAKTGHALWRRTPR
jgi:hypothetical protein